MNIKPGLNVLAAICLFLFSASFLAVSGSDASGKADEDSVLEAYGKLPLYFIENKGQLDSRVSFYVKTSGQTLYFTDEGIVFDLLRGEKGRQTAGPKTERLVFNLGFENAQKGVLIEGLDRQDAGVNYFVGKDRSKWKRGIPTYKGVVYKGVYKGIDLRVFGNGRDIEYEFIVNPWGNPDDILLTYNGIEGLSTNWEGELLITTAFGELKETRPYIYQEIEGEKAVEGGFVIRSRASQPGAGKFSYGFQVASYDPSYPLVIDPTLSYSTYLGGSGDDWGEGIALDSSGNAYVTGFTFSNNFPTQNPYQGTLAGVYDAFVTKLTSSGSVLSYSTYLGGSGDDGGEGIAVEGSGNAYVTGFTESSNFPTQNPYQGTLTGGEDAFVAKLSETIPPVPDIKANGSNGPINVSPSDPVSIAVSLDPGDKAGKNADWWIAGDTPFAPPLDWYTYVYPTGWVPGINLCAQTELFALSPYEVLNMPLPVGTYTFYFAIDDPGGGATGPWWGIDWVEVTVQ